MQKTQFVVVVVVIRKTSSLECSNVKFFPQQIMFSLQAQFLLGTSTHFAFFKTRLGPPPVGAPGKQQTQKNINNVKLRLLSPVRFLGEKKAQTSFFSAVRPATHFNTFPGVKERAKGVRGGRLKQN